MFSNRISSSTSSSIWLPETSPPSSSRNLLSRRFQSCNTSVRRLGKDPPGICSCHWNIYRIRSTDWSQNPAEEFRRLLSHGNCRAWSGLPGGEGEIRTPETLWDSMCGIRPEFGTLFSSKKSIRAAENMFAGDSALIRISSVPFVHYAYARNPVTSNSRQRLEFESTHSWAGAQRQFCLFPSSRGGVRVGGDFSLCAAEHRTAAFRVLLGSAGPDPVRPQKTRL